MIRVHDDDGQRQPDRDLAAEGGPVGQVVLVQRVEHQLDADEGQDDRQAERQIDQPLAAARRSGSTAGAGPSARTRWR